MTVPLSELVDPETLAKLRAAADDAEPETKADRSGMGKTQRDKTVGRGKDLEGFGGPDDGRRPQAGGSGAGKRGDGEVSRDGIGRFAREEDEGKEPAGSASSRGKADDEPATGSSYTVKKGDTLFAIAERELGDGNRWREIARASGLGKDFDPRTLQIGTKLDLPPKDGGKAEGDGDGGSGSGGGPAEGGKAEGRRRTPDGGVDRDGDGDSDPAMGEDGFTRIGSLDDVDRQIAGWSDNIKPEKRAEQRRRMLARARDLGASDKVLDRIRALPVPNDRKDDPMQVEFKDEPSTTIEHKADPGVGGAQVLSADDDTGRVVALVSVTGVEDRVKDIIEPGAYTKTLGEREPIGVWSHDDKTWVARTESAKELMPGDPFFRDIKTMDGKPWPKEAGAVLVEALFNLETPHGKAAYSDVKFFQGKTGWSIGYRATKAHRNMRTGVRHIKELDWFEFSPVMVGAASQPMTLSVKSMADAYSVDPDEAKGLFEEAYDELTADELGRLVELKESLGLEVKERRVRTPEGARLYGQPIGSVIKRDVLTSTAARLAPVGSDLKLGSTTYRVSGHTPTPEGRSYGNENGDMVDVRLESLNARGEVRGRTTTRLNAERLEELVAQTPQSDAAKQAVRDAAVAATLPPGSKITLGDKGYTVAGVVPNKENPGNYYVSLRDGGYLDVTLAQLQRLADGKKGDVDDLEVKMGAFDLEVKARVRTADGARRYGQPIGSVIIPDAPGGSVSAGSLAPGVEVDMHLQDPNGGPKDSVDVRGEITKVEDVSDRTVAVTVDGKTYKLNKTWPIKVTGGKGALKPGPVTDGELLAMLKEADDDDERAMLRQAAALPVEKRREFLTGGKAGGGKAGGGGDAPATPEAGSAAPKKGDQVVALGREAEVVDVNPDTGDVAIVDHITGRRSTVKASDLKPNETGAYGGDNIEVGGRSIRVGGDLSKIPEADLAAALDSLEKSKAPTPASEETRRKRIADVSAELKRRGSSGDKPADRRSLDERQFAASQARGDAGQPRGGGDSNPAEDAADEDAKTQALLRAAKLMTSADALRRPGGKKDQFGTPAAMHTELAKRYEEARAGYVKAGKPELAAVAEKRRDEARASAKANADAGTAYGKPAAAGGGDAAAAKPKQAANDKGEKVSDFVQITIDELRDRDKADDLQSVLDDYAKDPSESNRAALVSALEDVNDDGVNGEMVDDALALLKPSSGAGAKPPTTESRADRARARARADDLEADARVKERAKLAALNKRRRSQGKLPLLKLPDNMKALDLGEWTDDELELKVFDAGDGVEYGDPDDLEGKGSRASLDRSPKKNWVENTGELPGYIREVARAIERDHGVPLSRAIPMAIGRIKKWARGGGGVNADTVAKAAAAVAAWEKLKAKAHLKFDSELLDHIEHKALAAMDALEILEAAGLSVKVEPRDDLDDTADYDWGDELANVPLGGDDEKALPADEVADLLARAGEVKVATVEVDDFAALLERGDRLRAELGD